MSIKSSQKLVEEANEIIETLSPSEIKSLIEKNEITLIDVRDIRELWRDGTIENAKHIPRGMLEFFIDSKSPFHKEIFSQKKNFIFYCASGFRSALGTQTASIMGVSKVSNLSGGFSEWVKSGGAVEQIK